MNQLIFQGGASLRLKRELLASDIETAAILLATWSRSNSGRWRIMVREVVHVPREAYKERSGTSIAIRPSFLAGVIKRARVSNLATVQVHTHPWGGDVRPSHVDLQGEATLLPTLQSRVPGAPHGRLIIGQQGYDAALYPPNARVAEAMRIVDVGRDILSPMTAASPEASAPERFDRQVRAFGLEGQDRVSRYRVGIVGLGGTGSVVNQELAYLGVRDFLLIDNDVVEQSNLNRIVGAGGGDVGRAKVDVARETILAVDPRAVVEVLKGDVLRTDVARTLLDVDIFFCCTDSHGSRAVLNQLAYQHMLPGFDMGARIDVQEGRVTQITGRVQMLAPGLSCLVCSDLLDPEAVRRDLMSEAQRRADPYIVGGVEPQPSVISINSTVGSLAVTMFLSAVTGIPLSSRSQILRLEKGVVRSVESVAAPSCVVCSPAGAFGRGDAWTEPGKP